MKYILILLLWGITGAGYSQKKQSETFFPYQIIYAEQVKNTRGQEIKSLDLISMQDTLIISNGGFLSMIDQTGFPIEIKKDTSLVIVELYRLFYPLDKKRKNTKVNYTLRPYIEYLFISEGPQGRKFLLSQHGVIADGGGPDLEVFYPPLNKSIVIIFKDDLCIKWRPGGSDDYEVSIRNSFDEPLKTYYFTTNEMTLKADELKSLKRKESLLLITIKDRKTNNSSFQYGIKEFENTKIEYPYSCTIQKATHALMVAFQLETSRYDYKKEAEQYFKLAAQLSDKEFFKTMLSNFYNRRK